MNIFNKQIQDYKKNRKDKRGVMGLNTATSFILAMLTLVIIGFTTVIVLNSLNDADTSPVGSLADNVTTNIFRNATVGIQTFFSNSGTWFSLLAVVVIILIVASVIVVVNRFGQTNDSL